MKIFQNKYFNILLLLVFLLLILFLLIYGCFLGVSDVPTLIANAILMLLSTLFAVSYPLYATFRNDQDRKNKDTEIVIVKVSEYIGCEILDNLIEISDILKNKTDSEEKFNLQATLSETNKKMVLVGMWSVVSEDLISSLEDKQHQSIIQSGLVAKIESEKLSTGIRLTYQKMDNLIKRLRRLSKFCSMLLSPPVDTPPQFFDYELNVEFNKGVKAVEDDVKSFKKEAAKTIKEINRLLEPYGKEIKIAN